MEGHVVAGAARAMDGTMLIGLYLAALARARSTRTGSDGFVHCHQELGRGARRDVCLLKRALELFSDSAEILHRSAELLLDVSRF